MHQTRRRQRCRGDRDNGTTVSRTPSAVDAPWGRTLLTAAMVAAMVDEPLYSPELGHDDVFHRSRRAAELGLASVMCRPMHVAVAAEAVAGTSVKVTTSMGVYDPHAVEGRLQQMLREAEHLLADGARELVLVATARRLEPGLRDQFAAQLRAVAGLAGSVGVLVRVALHTSTLSTAQVVTGCRISADAGAGIVQAGTWFGQDRAGLSTIQLIRRELPPETKLKWTSPVHSLDRLLIACAEGVSRFNVATPAVLAEAEDRASSGGIRVPVAGVDY